MVLMIIILTISTSIGLYAFNLVDLENAAKSGNVLYRGSEVTVQIPDVYEMNETDLRAVWISTMTGDVARYTSKEQYIAEMESVFEVMEYYNLNAMIFHVRIYNDALYDSNLNKRSTYYSTVNFNEWDPLEWLIEESHNRGIEFHAWMNPYRVKNSYSGTKEQYAASEPSYNIASNPEYLLSSTPSSDKTTNIILNPGEPAVRSFIVDTVIEFIERYDADAVHFDDYFYISSIDDTATRNKYNTENLSLADFRRKQVDLFIDELHDAMKSFNQSNNRLVQLGISPSGIYRNGSTYVPLEDYQYDNEGTLTYPLFTNTAGFAHYDNYLYSDTKKWIDNEWIDYIMPQSYWAFEQPIAGFAPIMDWWAAVVKNKNVNLYSGMGLYMATNSKAYSWYTNRNEALNQVLYGNKYPDIQGYSIYSYKHIKFSYHKSSNLAYYENFSKVKENAWTNTSILPEIRTYNPVNLGSVENLYIESNTHNTLKFDSLKDAKFYVIYRSVDNITYSPSEVIDVIGKSSNDIIQYTDIEGGNLSYNYAVKPMSITNTLGVADTISTGEIRHSVTFKGFNDEIIKIARVKDGSAAIPPIAPEVLGYNFIGWNQDFNNVNGDLVVTANYSNNQYTVTFVDGDIVLDTKIVNHGDNVDIDDFEKEGHIFAGYSKVLDNITENLVVTVYFAPIIYNVSFVDINGSILSTLQIKYNYAATAPIVDKNGFIGWDQDFSNITSDLIVKALYDNVYAVTFKVDDEVLVILDTAESFDLPTIPSKEGYNQVSPTWSITDFSNISTNTEVEALYTINTYTVTFLDQDSNTLKEEIVEWNKSATAPTAPIVDGFDFDGWSVEFDQITEDLQVKALYVEKENNNSISCSGFSLQTAFLSLAAILYIVFKRKK